MTSIRPLSRFADAYAIAWRARQDLARPTLLLVVVFSSLQFGLIWALIGSESVWANVLVLLVVIAGEMIALVMFFVGCTRYFLLPDHDFATEKLMRWRRRHTRFAVAVIQIMLVVFAFTVIASFVIGTLGLTIHPAIWMSLVVAFIAPWLLRLPAAALDQPLSFKDVRRLVKGNIFGLPAFVLLVGLSVLLVFGIVENVVNLLGDANSQFVQFFGAFLTHAHLFVGAVIYAGGLSLAYRQLVIGETPKPEARPGRNPFLAVLTMAIIVLAFAGSDTWVKVNPREVGVLLRFGSPQAVLPPGTHSKLPFVQSVVAIDVDEWSSRFTSSAVSADGVPLETEVTYTYWVDDAIQNFVTLQGNAEFTDSSLAMLMQSVSSEVIGTKSLAVLNEDLLQINAELESRLSESANVYGVEVSWVQLRVTELADAQ